ncbi:EthD domain-containing protein [Orrella marina]|uniref:EthD domain-containing protein n=1 Tax=Orrella marina TaxID=2163011 RepID=A0A2R4XH54_9BURK|nr:EthD domain-containing protein [Orrella marina]AWB33157.1 hypothetical protein DBV39_04890 [Orrella marina]
MTIYRSALISRKASLSEAAFKSHWIEVHGELARKLPGLLHYRQNHILDRVYEAPAFPLQRIDGISQLAFQSIEAMERSDASQAYALTKEDIPKFQGEITILVLKAFELVQRRSAEVLYKVILVSTRGMHQQSSWDPVEDWWPSVKAQIEQLPGLRGLTQNKVIDRNHPVSAGIPSGDGRRAEALTELWFDSERNLNEAISSELFSQFMTQDFWLRTVAIYRIQEVKIC